MEIGMEANGDDRDHEKLAKMQNAVRIGMSPSRGRVPGTPEVLAL